MSSETVGEHSLRNAKKTIKLVQTTLDSYWAPAEGHKVSWQDTNEKLADFLMVVDSGQCTARSEDEKLRWSKLECQIEAVRHDIKLMETLGIKKLTWWHRILFEIFVLAT